MIDTLAWSILRAESDAIANLPPSPPIIYHDEAEAYNEAYWATRYAMRWGFTIPTLN